MAGLKFEITGDNSSLLRSFRESQEAASSMAKKIEDSGASIDGVINRITTAAAGMLTAFSAQQFASKVMSVRGEFQQLEVAFTTMLGSASEASRLMDQLVKTAATTPFDLQGVANGAKQLLAYGTSADEVNETLVRLGDIAAGLSIPLGDLVYLYGTTMVQGRMFTMDLRQFQGRGVPIADELAKQFGVAKEKVSELVTAGKVGAEEFNKAIVSMTSEGGRFAGLMEKQSHTITGQISNIEDAITNMFDKIGEKNEGVINTGLGAVSYLVEHWEAIGKVVLEVAVAYGTYKAALLAVYAAHKVQAIYGTVTAFLSLAKGVSTAKDAMLLFNLVSKSNPIGLIVSVITSAAAAFYLFSKNTDAAAKAQESLSKIEEEAAGKAAEEKTKIDLLVAAAKNDKLSMDERKEAIRKLNDLIPDYNAQLDVTTGRYIENKAALDRYLQSLARKYELEGAKEKLAEIGRKKANAQLERDDAVRKQKSASAARNVTYGNAGAFIPTPVVGSKEVGDQTKRINEANEKLREALEEEKLILNRYGVDLQKDAVGVSPKPKSTKSEKSIQEQKKELQAELEALSYKEAAGKKGATLRKRIRDLAKKEKVYSASYDTDNAKESERKAKEAERKAKQAADKAKREREEAKREAERISEETRDRNKAIKDYEDNVLEQQKETELALRQQNINLKEESYEKEIEQINLNYDRLIAENEKRRKDMIEALKDKKVNEWFNQNPKATKAQQEDYRNSLNLTENDLNVTQKAQLDEYDAIADSQKLKAQKDLYRKLLGEFQDYEARRTKINADFDKKRKDLEAMPADTKGRENAIAELERKRKESIKSVNDEEVSKMRESSTLFVDLFGDAADKSDKEIRKIIAETEELLSYLKNTKTGDITPNFGFTTEQLNTLKTSPEQIKAITEQLEKLKQAAKSSNPFKQLAEDLKNLFSKNKDGEGESVEAKLKKLGASASETADLIGGITGKLSEMFEAAGNTGMADAMESVTDIMSSVSNIGKGFAQGGIIGGVAAAAGEAIGFVTKAFQASARHAEALKKIQQEVIAQQRAYNLALLEEKLAFGQASTVFGNLDYTKAVNAVGVLREAYERLNSELKGTAAQQKKYQGGFGMLGVKLFDYSEVQKAYSGLADIQIKTGHKKTGLFGWGKGKDIYSSILDVYPQLIDSAGNFNKKLAESIINSREFSGEGKEALKNMIDLYDKAEDATKQLKDYLSGIFGDLGNNMSDALVDAFKNGTDAGKAFGDSISKMLENIGKQMIFQTLFSGIIEDVNNKMLDVMKNQSMSADEKFKNYVDILDVMTTQILGQQGTFNDLMSKYKGMASEKGVSLFSSENEQQNATANGISSISYDQANSLIGLITAGNITREQTRALVDLMRGSVENVNQRLNELVNLSITRNSYLEEIIKTQKADFGFKSTLEAIEKNTRNI
jgi:tape measure domain protein|nr:MAG TPA: tail tape measure protein [Caudoviricetes sp.]